ncbi:hypothetical protein EfaecalisJ6_03000 [Enterococcus faecalis]|nr:hypothetical protein EfaecalisJ2_08320 [Enterococcus faecalis]GEJ71865.1 hypothetical protein EfaecalisJ5_13980 [Enterococcus faecalis]GEJ73482.1 hypothetical protein EfaecalisJ6_03000 [Enterococcus faecalis]GEJ89170.1 hypothetical protein EfaecalisJ11_23880 [Enterococcus faecalis]GEJ97416.1 hypothetical protein EfaecalisJ14_24090 [Enterococcus faecalis]
MKKPSIYADSIVIYHSMYRVKHVSFATLFVLECFYGGGFFERKFFEAKKDGEKSYIRTSWKFCWCWKKYRQEMGNWND